MADEEWNTTRYQKDLDVRGLAMPVDADDMKTRNVVYDVHLMGSMFRPEGLPAAQPGIPVFGLSFTYGPPDAEDADRVRVSMDLTLDQTTSLAQALTDALGQMLANSVEASLEAFVEANPEWGLGDA